MKIYANICDPSEADAVLANGAEGVGLFRSEFIYLDSMTEPTEDEQYQAYRKSGNRLLHRTSHDLYGAPLTGLIRVRGN